MGRKTDADLARLKGWQPGDILLIERVQTAYCGGMRSRRVLTAIGHRSLLLSYFYAEKGELGSEQQSTYALHKAVITKVGRWDFEAKGPVYDAEAA